MLYIQLQQGCIHTFQHRAYTEWSKKRTPIYLCYNFNSEKWLKLVLFAEIKNKSGVRFLDHPV